MKGYFHNAYAFHGAGGKEGGDKPAHAQPPYQSRQGSCTSRNNGRWHSSAPVERERYRASAGDVTKNQKWQENPIPETPGKTDTGQQARASQNEEEVKPRKLDLAGKKRPNGQRPVFEHRTR